MYTVAIKTCREATGDDKRALIEEATIMAQFNAHPNVR